MYPDRDFYLYKEDFFGIVSWTAATAQLGWLWTKTAAAGAPTVATVTADPNGAVKSLLDTATNEAEVNLFNHGDILSFDVDGIIEFGWRIKGGQSSLSTGVSIACGMESAHNATHDSIAAQLCFRVIAADSATAIVVEGDDTTTAGDLDDKSTGQTLGTAYRWLTCNLSNKNDIRFFIDGLPVATANTFTMAGYTAGLQPFLVLSKGTGASIGDSVIADCFYCYGRRQ